LHSLDNADNCVLSYLVYVYTVHAEGMRLAGSGLNYKGRLEINYSGYWGTVCDDDFDNLDANVTCYMLGFG